MQPVVHTYTSAPDHFLVNSFIIEGPRSLVLVDTQFVLSEARTLAEKLAATGKKLAGIIITHPHPDHYNGLATILAAHPATPVFATQATAQGIHDTAEPKRAYWTPIIGADYPQSFAFPDTIIADGQTIEIDGIELRVTDFGAAECADNTAYALPQIDTVIISDLVYNRVHPWLAEGRAARWLSALDEAHSPFGAAARLLPGHGPAGGPQLLQEQATYIAAMQDAVAAAQAGPNGALDDAARDSIRTRMNTLFPGFGLPNLIDLNADALAAL
jgi:glyoxylase-like metal-dependent hydrolase (beta-lactamase superfamily II)